jgi:hypothetical protein
MRNIRIARCTGIDACSGFAFGLVFFLSLITAAPVRETERP